MKILQFVLFLVLTGVNAQSKDASDFFKSHSVSRKVNNALLFIDKFSTIILNDYNKSVIYTLVVPNHENSFSITLQNQLPIIDKKQLKCFQINNNKFVVFVDKSEENFTQSVSYKKNFELKTKEVISCDGLFKQLKSNKLPKIPANVFAYSIFEETFVYLEDLATFDALQYLQIEYDLNK